MTSNGRAIMMPVNLSDQFRYLPSDGSRFTLITLRLDEASMKCAFPCSSLMQRPVCAMSMPSSVVQTPYNIPGLQQRFRCLDLVHRANTSPNDREFILSSICWIFGTSSGCAASCR